jgi:hypothetical protein
MIFLSYVVMYLFYFAIELIWLGTAYLYAPPDVRKIMKDYLLLLPLMPLYRITIFLFRVSGFLYAINEPFSWAVPNPIHQLQDAWKSWVKDADGFANRILLKRKEK